MTDQPKRIQRQRTPHLNKEAERGTLQTELDATAWIIAEKDRQNEELRAEVERLRYALRGLVDYEPFQNRVHMSARLIVLLNYAEGALTHQLTSDNVR